MAYAPGPVRRGTAHLIRDARRRSARGLHTYAAHKGDCGNVLAASMGIEQMTKRVRIKCGACKTVNVAVFDAKGET